jgi:hypothetical protein
MPGININNDGDTVKADKQNTNKTPQESPRQCALNTWMRIPKVRYDPSKIDPIQQDRRR